MYYVKFLFYSFTTQVSGSFACQLPQDSTYLNIFPHIPLIWEWPGTLSANLGRWVWGNNSLGRSRSPYSHCLHQRIEIPSVASKIAGSRGHTEHQTHQPRRRRMGLWPCCTDTLDLPPAVALASCHETEDLGGDTALSQHAVAGSMCPQLLQSLSRSSL